MFATCDLDYGLKYIYLHLSFIPIEIFSNSSRILH